jgi:hypothetical protein
LDDAIRPAAAADQEYMTQASLDPFVCRYPIFEAASGSGNTPLMLFRLTQVSKTRSSVLGFTFNHVLGVFFAIFLLDKVFTVL